MKKKFLKRQERKKSKTHDVKKEGKKVNEIIEIYINNQEDLKDGKPNKKEDRKLVKKLSQPKVKDRKKTGREKGDNKNTIFYKQTKNGAKCLKMKRKSIKQKPRNT